MSDIANLLREAAEVLKHTSWAHNALSAKLEIAAESLGEPVAWRAVGPSYTYVVTDPERATDSRWEPLYLAPQPAVPDGLVQIHDWLLSLSCYPDSYPMDAMKRHLSDLQHKLSAMLAAAFPNGEKGDRHE